jgi:hypothetical protein
VKTTKEKAAVMIAHADGAQLEISVNGGPWKDYFLTEPRWNWDEHDYRIKPKPRVAREFWVHEYKAVGFTGFAGHTFSTLEDAKREASSSDFPTPRAIIHVREVLPDETP